MLDPSIRQYPVRQIVESFNAVAGSAPSLAYNPAFMNTYVRRHLAQGRAFDPAELAQIATTAKTVAQSPRQEELDLALAEEPAWAERVKGYTATRAEAGPVRRTTKETAEKKVKETPSQRRSRMTMQKDIKIHAKQFIFSRWNQLVKSGQYNNNDAGRESLKQSLLSGGGPTRVQWEALQDKGMADKIVGKWTITDIDIIK